MTRRVRRRTTSYDCWRRETTTLFWNGAFSLYFVPVTGRTVFALGALPKVVLVSPPILGGLHSQIRRRLDGPLGLLETLPGFDSSCVD